MIFQNQKRVCLNCKSKTTYIHKQGNEDWYVRDLGFICSNCYNRERRIKFREILIKRTKICQEKNPDIIKRSHTNRVLFYNRYIQLKINPRKGICSKCNRSKHLGEIRQTHIHHLFYNPLNPLSQTIELCASCHAQETWKSRKRK